MRAVHFGAGNIGRGFLGQLYWESGWDTVFVDVVEEVVSGLRARGWYPLDIVEGDGAERLHIDRVSAVDARSAEDVVRVVAAADLLSTAVGGGILSRIAPLIARGLAARWTGSSGAPRPLDIIICENLMNAAAYFREEVGRHLPADLHPLLTTHAGFVEASVGRMVPVRSEEQRALDPLLLSVEPYCELPVDAEAFRGPIPSIAHLKPMRNFGAYVERKLFVHNMSHAATAYAGYQRKHEFIWQAIRDAEVRALVEGALEESCEGLAATRGLDRAGLQAHAADLVRRYHNTALGDQVARVARDPLRKLGRNDRLVGAGLMCIEAGVTPTRIARATALALRYDEASDPGALEIQDSIAQKGIQATLEKIAGLQPGEVFSLLVEEQYGSSL